jgi:alanyl-tRNA synthetase
MTKKLYYQDSHLFTFTASVLSCQPTTNGTFAVLLNQTAFFPEGGGQYSDTGKLDEADVLDVQEQQGEIIHYTNKPFPIGKEVYGEVEPTERYRKMQNHSGEHILSGLIHNLYQLENVGFHLGTEDVTIDLNGVLTRDQLLYVEKLANEAIYKNLDIITEFPDSQKLSTLSYRSKLELTENVRIVTIPGYDVCACCAPHVSKTGEIGILKILDFSNYKGGIRVHILCGWDAVRDYEIKYRNVSSIGNALSAKTSEVDLAVSKLLKELTIKKQEIAELSEEIVQLRAASFSYQEGNLVFFCKMNTLPRRKLADLLSEKCSGISAIFSGNDQEGYQYVMASKTVDLRKKSKEINEALKGRGGGQSAMISGSVSATESEIRSYLNSFLF